MPRRTLCRRQQTRPWWVCRRREPLHLASLAMVTLVPLRRVSARAWCLRLLRRNRVARAHVARLSSRNSCWRGEHALNNYMGGPYITEAACRAAARLLAHEEDRAFHLDPRSGWLSVDVMSVLGAGQLDVHIDESPRLIKSDPLGRSYLAQ